MKTFTITTTIRDEDAVVSFDYYPGDPGRTYGPPENCYPPEPDEIEILSVKINDEEVELTEDELEKLEDRIYNDAGDLYAQVLESDKEDSVAAYYGYRDACRDDY